MDSKPTPPPQAPGGTGKAPYQPPPLPEEPITRMTNADSKLKPQKILNINIGVLGHIDSGKTSLCRALSTIASTAGFDKNPQSKERGITLDLGFSAFIIEIPTWFREKHEKALESYEYLQFTLVDCPGHASLMKTIIGGASIIDFMMLVIDSQKLIQTQTAECIVLGEILMDKLIIAMNKVDMFPNGGPADPALQKHVRQLRVRFKHTKFGAYLPIVPVAAAMKATAAAEQPAAEGKDESEPAAGEQPVESYGIEDLIKTILVHIDIPNRENKNQHFQFAIDHCFQIKGQGTVMTDTVLGGQVKVGETIELPSLKVEKKVKSMQMFRKPVQIARQGDRVGMCVAQLDPSQIERALACTPHTMQSCETVLAAVEKIKFFTDKVNTKTKFHITIGHQTAIGLAHFFSMVVDDQAVIANGGNKFNFTKGNFKDHQGDVYQFDHKQFYQFEDELVGDALPGTAPKPKQEEAKVSEAEGQITEQAAAGTSGAGEADDSQKMYFAIIQLEKQVLIQQNSLLIGSKLDKDISAKQCRLAFYGQVINLIKQPEVELPQINVIKEKLKHGKVDRINDAQNILIRELFQKETAPDVFVGLKVTLTASGQQGTIQGTFGKSGKLKVRLDTDIPNEMLEDPKLLLNTEVTLRYKKSVWEEKGGKKVKNKFKFN